MKKFTLALLSSASLVAVSGAPVALADDVTATQSEIQLAGATNNERPGDGAGEEAPEAVGGEQKDKPAAGASSGGGGAGESGDQPSDKERVDGGASEEAPEGVGGEQNQMPAEGAGSSSGGSAGGAGDEASGNVGDPSDRNE